MKFSPILQKGQFLRRYKRFLVDILTNDQKMLTIHCPNTGSMKNCLLPESPCWYSTSDNLQRKYPHTLEIVTTPAGHLAGVNTSLANRLVHEAILSGVIRPLQGYSDIRSEVMYGDERSRADFVLTAEAKPRCIVEVKNVTLLDDCGGCFPDAVSERGSKHLRELIQVAGHGERAVLVFCVQHQGISSVAPAAHIDKEYTRLCQLALQEGVEFYAYKADLSEQGVTLTQAIPVLI